MSSADPQVRQSVHVAADLDETDVRKMYYFMRLTRSVEDRVRRLYLQGRLQGAVYSSRGQEGTAVASAYALRDGDYVAPLIRDLGASFTRGVEPRHVFAQWLGRSGGLSGGRDGNLHFGDLEHGVLPPISMLGAAIPLCAGIGLASQQQGSERVALTYIGDGGTNTGDFHEGLNFAAVLRLPLVLIVEDNGFAYSTPVAHQVAIKDFAERGAAYGVPSVTVDGNNALIVYRAAKRAVDLARSGGGPTLIEAKTFRMRGHAEHDDASYVPPELISEWEQRDPIQQLATYAAGHGLMDSAIRAEIDDRIEDEIETALAWAENSPLPDRRSQTEGVYATRV
jgi:TPP-dependent pyruvate/acetoin dehydrogenase alpha subunit